MSSRDNESSRKLKPPSEIEASLKLRMNGKDEEKQEKAEEPVIVETRERKLVKVQKVSRQENKSIVAGKRFEIHKETSRGFLQSFFLYYTSSAVAPALNLQLDLGKYGAFTVNFEEYFNAGMVLAHSAQDFWISKKDDSAKKYGIAMTPSIPIEFDSLRIIVNNDNSDDITVVIAQTKFYIEIEEEV